MSDAVPNQTSTLSEFLPKIVTVWREGYHLGDLRADAGQQSQPQRIHPSERRNAPDSNNCQKEKGIQAVAG